MSSPVGSGAVAEDASNSGASARFTVLATLVGSLIGGLFGFGGSALVFWNAEKSLQQSQLQYSMNMRRDAYMTFLDAAGDTRRYFTVAGSRAMANGNRTVPADSEGIDSHLLDLNSALTRVYLVAPSGVRDEAYHLVLLFEGWDGTLETRNGSYDDPTQRRYLDDLNVRYNAFEEAARKSLMIE
jgi:hypothetical protein